MGCHFLLQEIFLTWGSNPCLLHWQVGSLPLSHLGSPTNLPRWTLLVKISHSHRSSSQDPGFVFPDDNLLWSARLSEVEFTVGFILGVWEVGSLLNGHGSFLPHTLRVKGPTLEWGKAGVRMARDLQSEDLTSSPAMGHFLPVWPWAGCIYS